MGFVGLDGINTADRETLLKIIEGLKKELRKLDELIRVHDIRITELEERHPDIPVNLEDIELDRAGSTFTQTEIATGDCEARAHTDSRPAAKRCSHSPKSASLSGE